MNIIIAILAIVILGLFLAFKRERHHSQYRDARSMELSIEIDFYRERLGVIHLVIAGVTKRITEHTEIVEAIKLNSPALFDQEPGLKYWLSANDEFFVELYAATYPTGHPYKENLLSTTRPQGRILKSEIQ